MFRPMRRPKNAIPDEQAKKLLREEKRGVIAMNGDDGYPFAIPVDYFYDETAGKIYFHGAKSGYKVDALRRCDKVCFTVYGGEFYKNDHWAPYVQSVLVYGRCRLVENIAVTEARVRELAMKYYPSAEEVEAEIAKDLRAVQLYEITVEHIIFQTPFAPTHLQAVKVFSQSKLCSDVYRSNSNTLPGHLGLCHLRLETLFYHYSIQLLHSIHGSEHRK